MKLNNLELPKTIERKILDKTMEIKPYLTSSEIGAIVEVMLTYDSFLERKMVRDLCLLRFCTNIEVDDSEYDLYETTGLIDEVKMEIPNKYIQLIEDCVKQKESINTYIKDFLKEINKNLSKGLKNIEKINLKELTQDITRLENLQNKVNKNGI